MARVTVGIPTWNRSALLRESIESVLGQTFDDLELFVFDDGSTDDTADVVASYDDRRLTYVRNPENLGHARNVTQILRAGTGPYVAMLFDDDTMYPDHLQRMVALLDRHPAAAVAHGAYELWTLDGQRILQHLVQTEGSEPVVQERNAFLPNLVRFPPGCWVATALMRRSCVQTLDFRAVDEPPTDTMFWMRVALHGSFVYDPHPSACMRVTPGYTTESGLGVIDESGGFQATFTSVRGLQAVFSRFRREHAGELPVWLRWRLRLEETRTRHRMLERIIRAHAPGLGPSDRVRSLLAEAARIDPTVVIDPIVVHRLLRERRQRSAPGGDDRRGPATRGR